MVNFKELLLPPAIALGLYLSVIYVCLPLYRQRQRYAQYVPISLPASIQNSLPSTARFSLRSWLADRITNYAESRYGDHRRSYSGGLSDEELEPVDGLDAVYAHEAHTGRPGVYREDSQPRSTNVDSERRLSRDLEAGFRDDSESEEEEERGRR